MIGKQKPSLCLEINCGMFQSALCCVTVQWTNAEVCGEWPALGRAGEVGCAQEVRDTTRA